VGYNPKKRGRPSYLPLLCFDGNTRYCWEGTYHPGDTHVSTVTIPLLEHAFAKLPHGIQEVRMRADGAFFDHKIIEFMEGKRAFYAIVARLTRTVPAAVAWLVDPFIKEIPRESLEAILKDTRKGVLHRPAAQG
jgi:hypothetical protein